MSARLQEIRVRDFNIRHTFESAQPLTFYADFDYAGKVLTYPSKTKMITTMFAGDSRDCTISVYGDNSARSKQEVFERFRLSDNMQRIYRRIGTDKFMRNAIGEFRGMRLTLNDPWETALCFIISQFNNVKRITLITHNIMGAFGVPIADPSGIIAGKALPTCDILRAAPEKRLRLCGAGFRAKYLVQAAEFCTNNISLESLRHKNYEKLKRTLLEIPGVGDKVADCIALMGYGKLEAFPIDVWVKRTLEKAYFRGEAKKLSELHEFAEERFPGCAGYAEQYIYWYGRQVFS